MPRSKVPDRLSPDIRNPEPQTGELYSNQEVIGLTENPSAVVRPHLREICRSSPHPPQIWGPTTIVGVTFDPQSPFSDDSSSPLDVSLIPPSYYVFRFRYPCFTF